MPIHCADPGVSEENSALLRTTAKLREAHKGRGDAGAWEGFVGVLRGVGFVDVRREGLQWAFGKWAKEKVEKSIGRRHLREVVLRYVLFFLLGPGLGERDGEMNFLARGYSSSKSE